MTPPLPAPGRSLPGTPGLGETPGSGSPVGGSPLGDCPHPEEMLGGGSGRHHV